MSIQEVNSRLLKVFGLEGLRVRELTVHAAVDEVPTITVTRMMLQPGDVRSVTQVFGLVPAASADPYEAAMARVQEVIDQSARRASVRLRADHLLALRTLGITCAI